MSEADFKVIDTEVGLFGGTILLIGNIIAMTVFLLPAHLVADYGIGSEMVFAMAIVALPMTFRILGQLQVGGAMPAAGGSYVYASRLIHPYFGFLLPLLVIPAIWAGQLYLAVGFAEFMRFYELFAWIPLWALMYAVMIPFIIINVLGIRVVTQVQMVLVAIIVIGMLLFIVPGATEIDTSNYSGMFDTEIAPLFSAIVTLSIAMHGFGLATDLGEELKDPVRNIPRILGLSAVISITLMVAVIVVAVGVVPVEFYLTAGTPGGEGATAVEAGVAVAAADFSAPLDMVAPFVALAAVVGAFTSLNTLYTAYSRQLMRAARDEAIPLYFAKIHSEYQTPYRAILLLAIPALLLVPFTYSVSPALMAAVLAMTSLVGGLFSAFALWNLPKRFPDRYNYSIYKLPMPLLKFTAIMSFTVSVIFVVGFSLGDQNWMITAAILTWMAVVYFLYRYRLRQFDRRGIDLKARMKDLHTYEHDRAQAGSKQESAIEGDATQESTAREG